MQPRISRKLCARIDEITYAKDTNIVMACCEQIFKEIEENRAVISSFLSSKRKVRYHLEMLKLRLEGAPGLDAMSLKIGHIVDQLSPHIFEALPVEVNVHIVSSLYSFPGDAKLPDKINTLKAIYGFDRQVLYEVILPKWISSQNIDIKDLRAKLDEREFSFIAPHLTKLLFGGKCLIDRHFRAFMAPPPMGEYFSADGLCALITPMARLQRIFLSRLLISEQVLLSLSQLKHLQVLEMHLCYPLANERNSSIGAPKALSYLTALKTFRACHTNIIPEGIDALATLTGLKRLDFVHSNIQDHSIRKLTSLSKLQKLTLWCCDITDHGVKELSKFTTLRALTLEGCKEITNDGIKELVTLTELKKLNLNRCEQISDVSIQALMTLKNIQELKLAGCTLRDISLKEIAKLINLTTLDLSYSTDFTDAGLKELIPLRLLETILLIDCFQISDWGIENLALIVSLCTLFVCGLPITDAALQRLTTFPCLSSIYLGGCHKITDIALQKLKKQKKNLKITV